MSTSQFSHFIRDIISAVLVVRYIQNVESYVNWIYRKRIYQLALVKLARIFSVDCKFGKFGKWHRSHGNPKMAPRQLRYNILSMVYVINLVHHPPSLHSKSVEAIEPLPLRGSRCGAGRMETRHPGHYERLPRHTTPNLLTYIPISESPISTRSELPVWLVLGAYATTNGGLRSSWLSKWPVNDCSLGVATNTQTHNIMTNTETTTAKL